MMRALLMASVCICVIQHCQNDVAVGAFPLQDCWNTKIDLLLIGHSVADGFGEQMRFFSLLIDLFLDPSEVELHRIKVAMATYRITSTNGFQYQEVFDYSKYDNKTEVKEFTEGLSYSEINFYSETFNTTFDSSAPINILNARKSAQQVSVFVVEHSQVNRLIEDDKNYWNGNSNLFFFVVDDYTYNSPIRINPQNYVRVKNYESLQHTHEIPLRLCGACYPEWFGFAEHQRESLLWTFSCYNLVLSEERIAWTDALKRCEERQSSLASIETAEELVFLEPKLLYKTKTLWDQINFSTLTSEFLIQIGLIRDRESLAKRFKWINGAPLTVTRWIDYSHPNGGYVQSCGAWIFRNFESGWDDFGCGYRNAYFYLCEASAVTLNPGYVNSSTVKNATTESIHSALLLGELANCPKSNSFVSASGIISEKDKTNCVLFVRQELESVHDWSKFVALFNCEDQHATFIAYSFVCDYKIHCPNGRDEDVCRYRQCDRLTEFTCRSKQCVPAEARCDLYKDCYDESDEIDCTDCKYTRCQDGTCLPTHWWFDDEIDCIWGDFSQGYHWDVDPPLEDNTVECAFMCNRTKCVTKAMMNNSLVDCTGPEGPLDETVGALEESSCQADTPVFNSAAWSPKCVYYRDRYDSPLGCRNMIHLQGCLNFTCSDGYIKCPGSYCVPMHQAHDGHKDCPRGEDEMEEFFPECGGNFLCMGSRVCLHNDLVCDGYPQCPNGDDELNCKISCMQGFLCVGGALTVYDYDRNMPLLSLNFIDPRTRYIDLSGVILSELFPDKLLELPLSSLNVLRLSGCGIKSLDNYTISNLEPHRGTYLSLDWFELSSVHTMDLSHNNIEDIGETSIIKTMHNLRVLNLSHNKKLKEIKIKAFELLGFPSSIQVLDLSYTEISTTIKLFDPLVKLTYLNLSHTPLADLKPGTFVSEGRVQLQFLDLRSTEISDFYPDTFKGVSISSGLYTDTYILCCPQVRGSGINSDVCHAPADPLSTCSDLIGEELKRILLWLAGLLAILGNLIVIVYRLRWTRPLLKKAYGMFVVHLAVSDVIMGVYLLIIASADVYYRDVYVWNEKRWRNNTLCQIAGFASTLSSEVSTCFIFFITVDRFLVIKYPFNNVRLSNKLTILVCSLVWFLGVAVAIVPLFPKFKHWKVYSSNGMCLGLPLTSQRPTGWQFSAAIFIGFNFVMFLLILCGQVTIYRTMISARKKQSDLCRVTYMRQQQEFAVARQLFLVAMSNFVCWFPIAVMGMISMGGYEIGLSAYAWSAVLIMPVNSAINPVLYTIPALLKMFAKFRKVETTKKQTATTQLVCPKCRTSYSINTTREDNLKK